GAGDALDLGLAAELAFGADLTRHAGDFRREHAELADHGVDELGGAEEFALQRLAVHFQSHRLRQVPLGDGPDGARDLGSRPYQVVEEIVDRLFHGAPRARGMTEASALADLAFLADDAADALELAGHAVIGGGDIVE